MADSGLSNLDTTDVDLRVDAGAERRENSRAEASPSSPASAPKTSGLSSAFYSTSSPEEYKTRSDNLAREAEYYEAKRKELEDFGNSIQSTHMLLNPDTYGGGPAVQQHFARQAELGQKYGQQAQALQQQRVGLNLRREIDSALEEAAQYKQAAKSARTKEEAKKYWDYGNYLEDKAARKDAPYYKSYYEATHPSPIDIAPEHTKINPRDNSVIASSGPSQTTLANQASIKARMPWANIPAPQAPSITPPWGGAPSQAPSGGISAQPPSGGVKTPPPPPPSPVSVDQGASGAQANKGAQTQTPTGNDLKVPEPPPANSIDSQQARSAKSDSDIKSREKYYTDQIVPLENSMRDYTAYVQPLENLAVSNPKAWGILNKPGVFYALLNAVEKGVDIGNGFRVNAPAYDLVKHLKLDQDELNSLTAAGKYINGMQLAKSRILGTNPTNFEREMLGSTVINKDDAPALVLSQAKVIKRRAEFDDSVANLWTQYTNANPYFGSGAQFKQTQAYKNLYKKYADDMKSMYDNDPIYTKVKKNGVAPKSSVTDDPRFKRRTQ